MRLLSSGVSARFSASVALIAVLLMLIVSWTVGQRAHERSVEQLLTVEEARFIQQARALDDQQRHLIPALEQLLTRLTHTPVSQQASLLAVADSALAHSLLAFNTQGLDYGRYLGSNSEPEWIALQSLIQSYFSVDETFSGEPNILIGRPQRLNNRLQLPLLGRIRSQAS